MEIKLWKLSPCLKWKFYCFEDFTKPLAFFVYIKALTKESKGIKISCMKFLYKNETHEIKTSLYLNLNRKVWSHFIKLTADTF